MVWLDAPGSVLFTQKRVGKEKRIFLLHNFRVPKAVCAMAACVLEGRALPAGKDGIVGRHGKDKAQELPGLHELRDGHDGFQDII